MLVTAGDNFPLATAITASSGPLTASLISALEGPTMREPLDASPTQAISSHVRMIVGASDVLEYQQLLQELAHRFGQPAAMHGVEHFLRGAGRGMTPYLLFVLADPHAPIPLTPDNILGAALLHEFCLLGIGSGIFVSEGKDGLRSIIAPSDSRALIAATSASALLDHKGQVIVASYIQTTHSALAAPQALRWRSFHWATASRSAPGYLPLRETLDLTLQSLNKKTRFNFRYYRRLLEAETPLEFVADAGALLSLPQLQADLRPPARRLSLRPPHPGRRVARPHWRLAPARHHGAAVADQPDRLRALFPGHGCPLLLDGA
jgi:hypothetical protein